MTDQLKVADDDSLIYGLNRIAAPIIEQLQERGYEVRLDGARFIAHRKKEMPQNAKSPPPR